MQYTKEGLNEFNLYSLRELGREIGVKAPSSLKKAELIENILSVQNGKIAPHVTKKGRPALPKKPTPTEEEIKQIIRKIVEDGREKLNEELREIERNFIKEILEDHPPFEDNE